MILNKQTLKNNYCQYKYTKCYGIIIGDVAANSALSLFLFSANFVFVLSFLVLIVYFICGGCAMRTYSHCVYWKYKFSIVYCCLFAFAPPSRGCTEIRGKTPVDWWALSWWCLWQQKLYLTTLFSSKTGVNLQCQYWPRLTRQCSLPWLSQCPVRPVRMIRCSWLVFTQIISSIRL